MESPLLSLPLEVRERIYEFYLVFNHNDFEDTLRPQHVYIDGPPHVRPLPSLMLASKALYRELSEAVHGQAALRVLSHGWADRRIGFAVHGTLRFERLRKLWLVLTAEYPKWNSWLSFFGAVAERAPHLNTLVIDWAPRNVAEAGWKERANIKKEEEFCAMLAELKELRHIHVYGDISSRWMSQLEKTVPHVVHHKFRWWREPGLDW
ncbi:hypothetical protein F4821DRAFT_228614 [Hypoxylon rubiginosum]|uniref:Uncharacterized protein n=1 Tax=Hypoxylon rubiginosum TaxID=110542 RepID=A0ACC0DDL7_9PEZI|nr:hypothetical protein F4821DRAFT_228614 [Hypoxylon rubiginosum]